MESKNCANHNNDSVTLRCLNHEFCSHDSMEEDKTMWAIVGICDLLEH